MDFTDDVFNMTSLITVEVGNHERNRRLSKRFRVLAGFSES